MKKKIYIALGVFLLAASAIVVEAYYGNIDQYGYYNITNTSWLFGKNFSASEYFIGSGSLLTGIPTYNSSYDAQLGHNTTAEIRAAQTVNTSAEVNAAINSTFTGQLGKNTTAEINAALNSTFTGQLGKNTTAEIRAAVNASGNYVFNASTAGTCNEAGLLDGYDSAYFYGLNKTMDNATVFADNDKLLFGTGTDVAMYFNGTHFVIEST